MPPRDVSYFLKGWAIGWCRHAPKGCFLLFWKGRGLISYQVPKQFPSITYQNPFVLIKFQTIPIKFLLFSSITHQNLSVPIKFQKIPLIPISNLSKSFCFHQVPIKFLLFPSSSWKCTYAKQMCHRDHRPRQEIEKHFLFTFKSKITNHA
jgi:hypothetical protein